MEDNNYLWDRTGEVDPEVQELEEVLGTLRYQPRPLQIPADIRIGRRRTFFPTMAIAAAIALIAVALGIWFSFGRQQSAPQFDARTGSQPRQDQSEIKPDKETFQAAVSVNEKPTPSPSRRREPPRNVLASNKTGGSRRAIRQPELTPQELAQKEQVLIALRLVSAKLNIAQRMTQGAPSVNVIRNHRIG